MIVTESKDERSVRNVTLRSMKGSRVLHYFADLLSERLEVDLVVNEWIVRVRGPLACIYGVFSGNYRICG
jgi:hypothetical protein